MAIDWDTYRTKDIKNKYVYRYLTIDKLISFFETNSLYLSRLDKFDDNLENIEPYNINELKMRLGYTTKPEDASPFIEENLWDEIIQKNIIQLRSIQKKLIESQKRRYVSCWILNDVESFAMWDIYGKSGFALRFEQEYFQRLIKGSIPLQKNITSKLDLLVAGNVQYQNFDEMSLKEEESLIKYSVFRKHLSFNHESEYRIVGFMKEEIEESGLKFILPNIEALKFDVIANPRLKSSQFEIFQNMLLKYSKKHILRESELKMWLDFRNNTY